MKCPKYRKLYAKSYSKELGRLSQGMPGVVNGTNIIFLINKTDVPAEQYKDSTYGHVVVNYCPEIGCPHCTRLTERGNLIAYPGNCGTPTVDLLTVKMLLLGLFTCFVLFGLVHRAGSLWRLWQNVEISFVAPPLDI